jgi:hypothetical protein
MKNTKIDGAQTVWQKRNKKLFSCQKFQHTNEEGSTNARSVEKNLGCKVEDRQLNQFIKQNCDQKYYFRKKSTY